MRAMSSTNTNITNVSAGRKRPFDITNVSDLAAENFMLGNEHPLCMEGGRIDPEPDGVRLTLNGRRRSKFFPKAWSAIRLLRRHSKTEVAS